MVEKDDLNYMFMGALVPLALMLRSEIKAIIKNIQSLSNQ